MTDAIQLDQTQPTATPAAPPKPGYKTTEFWLSLLATLLTYLYASGLLTSGTTLAIAGIAATVLTALGYKVARVLIKTAGAVVLLVAISSSQIGCGRAKASLGRVAGGVVDCLAPSAKDAIAELAPAFGAVLRDATSGSGTVDWAPVRAVAAPLKSALSRCAFASVIAEALRPSSPRADAPQSSPLQWDPVSLSAGFEELRVDWGGQQFQLSGGLL